MDIAAGGIGAGLSSAGAAPGELSDADRAKVKQFARDFEAMLMTEMLKQMRRSMLTEDEDEGSGLGRDTMTDTMDSQLGIALSNAGGFGLAGALMRALDRQTSASTRPASGTSASVGAVSLSVPTSGTSLVASPDSEATTDAPGQAAEGAVSLAQPAGAVTSPFGWRTDPINGQTRFHAGADIRSAYGRDVHAAAAGRVAFAGEKGAYGETLVIDHGNGVETRYAHLSGYTVREGDVVEAGQVVARSGNSGRTTGPHLHFEVLKGGRTVDPSEMAHSLGAKDFPVTAESDHE